MKIRICSGKYRILIPVPYFVMNNPVSMMVVRKTLHEDGYQVDPDTAVNLIKEFIKMAVSNRGLELVRVETADGQFVQIVL